MLKLLPSLFGGVLYLRRRNLFVKLVVLKLSKKLRLLMLSYCFDWKQLYSCSGAIIKNRLYTRSFGRVEVSKVLGGETPFR